jgi:transposase
MKGLKPELKHSTMSNDATYPGPQVQIISADEPVGRGRRRWNADDKLRIVEEALASGESISAVARRNGVAPNLLYRWRRLALEGGAVAITGDDSVTSDKTVRELQSQIKELERQLGRKTMEVEILREAVEQSRLKKQTLRVLSLPRERGQ